MTLPAHLHTRTYVTKGGHARLLFYVRLLTWQGQRLKIPVGDNEKIALGRRNFILGLNTQRYNFLNDPDNHLGRNPPKLENAETLDKWIKRFCKLKAGKKSLDKDKWNAARLLKFFAGGGVDVALTEISAARIEDYKLTRTIEVDRNGKHPQPATINRELSLLRSILRMAYDQEALAKVPRIKLLPEHNERHRTATEQEYRLILKQLVHQPSVRDALEILWEQGLREDEVVSLRWPQVDLQAQTFLFVSHSTKDKKPRQPPMSPRTYEILSQRKILHPKGEWVFTTNRGGSLKPRWFKRLVQKAMDKAGIRGLWVHDLRGSFITRKVIEEGYDRKLVKVVTGHATDYAFERYLRPTREQAREMLRGHRGHAGGTQISPAERMLDNSSELF